MSKLEKSSPVDWQLARSEFEKGTSLRRICKIAGGSKSGIEKRAKRDGWRRSVDTRTPCPPFSAVATVPPLIAAAAFEPPEISKRGRSILLSLMAELEAEGQNLALLREVVEAETRGEKSPNRRRVLEKVLSLPVRTQAAKNLATALAALNQTYSKRAQAAADAENAGRDSEWGDDLNPPDGPRRIN